MQQVASFDCSDLTHIGTGNWVLGTLRIVIIADLFIRGFELAVLAGEGSLWAHSHVLWKTCSFHLSTAAQMAFHHLKGTLTHVFLQVASFNCSNLTLVGTGNWVCDTLRIVIIENLFICSFELAVFAGEGSFWTPDPKVVG